MKFGTLACGVLALTLTLSACGGTVGGAGADHDESTLTIGYVSPQTGPLAAFGEADSYVIEQMKAEFQKKPLKVHGKDVKVDIIVKDAQSDSTRASQVTADLINTDHVDLVLASSTPDVVNPVSEQCEANSVLCITTVAPWQTVAMRSGTAQPDDLKHTFHFFWGLEDVAAVYSDMWNQAGAGKNAGGLFPNDPDGKAWSENLPGLVKDSGVTITNPGLYPNGTKDFSAQISKLKQSDILVGVPIPPDLTTFWKQAYQQGYRPRIATIGKALLFPSVVEGIGPIANNLGTEVWWHPTAPWTSSLTGQTAGQLAEAYETKTGRQWTQPLGFSNALFEVAAAAVAKADSTRGEDLTRAMQGLKVDTVVGPLTWGAPGLPPYIAKTPLTGGQWRTVNGGKHPFDLVVVSNTLAPSVPTGGRVQPLAGG